MTAIATTQDYRNLSGPQKAAILILALGDVQGGKLFSLFHEDEIRETMPFPRRSTWQGDTANSEIDVVLGSFFPNDLQPTK